jgi:hypothetical protein|tara:strand:+ start:1331 stop:2218 length:888 start_codon:yes stop_codon:yes gene_type:complete
MGLINQTASNYYNSGSFGGYQFTSLQNVIDQFMLAYVGEEKIISKIRRQDVVFHAMRGLQEFSFDTFKSVKAYELEVPSTLAIPLPQDYVNYVKISFSDGAGIQRVLYPARKTSNPSNISQTATPDVAPYYNFTDNELVLDTESDTASSFIAPESSDAQATNYDYNDAIYGSNQGQRYGLEPEHAQINGSFYIDEIRNFIRFGSDLNGKRIIIEYISDSLGTDAEMQVHKFAEEALYKYIAYAVLSTRANTPPVLVEQYKRSAFAEKRKAKLRLSNIKLEEITQVLRGKSKQIKH